MNFTPLGKCVLVEREEELKKTSSGIVIPDSAKEKPLSAVVKSVGKEVNDVKSGDKVIFGKYSGTELTLDGKEYVVLETKDILGIVK